MKVVACAILVLVALPVLVAAQTAAAGRTIDATTQLPDTTYRVVVDQVTDPTHILVTFVSGDQNGNSATLTAGRPNMTFNAVHARDTLMLSTSKGTVLVFKDYGVQPASPAATP